MRKPTLFIGCSKENLDVANALHKALEFDAECSIWDQGTFRASDYPLESLEGAVDCADFAVFLFMPDDKTTMREEQLSTVRDNVVFELGIAIGRLGRKRAFIVVPRGRAVHIPTDLKGWTPIEFEPSRGDSNLRAAIATAASELREAFGQQGLRAKASLPAVIEEPDEPAPTPTIDWLGEYLKPETGWSFERLRHAWSVAIAVKRKEEVAALEGFFRASQFASSKETEAEWNGTADEERLLLGENIPLSGFKERAKAFPQNQRLQHQLADALSHYGGHSEARNVLEEAARRSSDLSARGLALGRAANQAKSTGEAISLSTYLSMLFELASNANEEDNARLLSSLRDIASHFGLKAITSALGEVLILSKPDDTSLRFDLAFGYADLGRNDLALIHYEGIPPAQRSAGAWNNLGVAFSGLLVPGLAVQSYGAAFDKGASVAAGNLANKLIGAGFFDQARELAERALGMEEHDESVDKILPAIHDAREKEEGVADTARANGRTQQTYMRALGKAAVLPSDAEVVGTWAAPDCSVEVNYLEDEEVYSAKGNYIQKSDGKGIGLGLFAPTSRSMKIEYRLRRVGNAFEGTVRREPQEGPTAVSFLGIGNYERSVTMMLAEDGKSLIARESGASEEVWTRAYASQS